MNELIIIVAKYFIVLSGLGIVVLFWRLNNARRWQLAWTVVIGGIIAYALAKLGGHLHYDPRPFVAGHVKPLIGHSNDNGFPSDHTLLASLLGFAALPFSRKWGGALLVLAAGIGLSRMAAHVHHAQDIIGSFIFTLIGVYIARVIVKRYMFGRQKPDIEE